MLLIFSGTIGSDCINIQCCRDLEPVSQLCLTGIRGFNDHGTGIAYGLDRLIMLLAREKSIRDVIAFPKIQNASCPMTEAPSAVDAKQLKELAIKLDEEEL